MLWSLLHIPSNTTCCCIEKYLDKDETAHRIADSRHIRLSLQIERENRCSSTFLDPSETIAYWKLYNFFAKTLQPTAVVVAKRLDLINYTLRISRHVLDCFKPVTDNNNSECPRWRQKRDYKRNWLLFEDNLNGVFCISDLLHTRSIIICCCIKKDLDMDETAHRIPNLPHIRALLQVDCNFSRPKTNNILGEIDFYLKRVWVVSFAYPK